MANLDALTKRGLRAYELGRLRMALRVALLLLPLATICLLEPAGREACACCAALLIASAVWFRFRDRMGVDAVSTGLLAGALPLACGLLSVALDPGCTGADPISVCTGLSIVSGAGAGAIVAIRGSSPGQRPGSSWLPLAFAALAGAMGCARLGIAGVLGVTLGLIVGRLVTPLVRRVELP